MGLWFIFNWVLNIIWDKGPRFMLLHRIFSLPSTISGRWPSPHSAVGHRGEFNSGISLCFTGLGVVCLLLGSKLWNHEAWLLLLGSLTRLFDHHSIWRGHLNLKMNFYIFVKCLWNSQRNFSDSSDRILLFWHLKYNSTLGTVSHTFHPSSWKT